MHSVYTELPLATSAHPELSRCSEKCTSERVPLGPPLDAVEATAHFVERGAERLSAPGPRAGPRLVADAGPLAAPTPRGAKIENPPGRETLQTPLTV